MNVALLLRKCATVWQNMAINTIQSYGAVALDPSRRVHLSGDRTRWIAPHNDPVFAELNKCPFSHEMPVVYATRLCEKWLDAIVEGAEYAPSRDGQAGGVAIDSGDVPPGDLYPF